MDSSAPAYHSMRFSKGMVSASLGRGGRARLPEQVRSATGKGSLPRRKVSSGALIRAPSTARKGP